MFVALACADPSGDHKVDPPGSSASVDATADSRPTADDSGPIVDSGPVDSVPIDSDSGPEIVDTGTMRSGDWVDVSAGWYATCGVRGSGEILCWGENDNGLLDVPEGSYRSVAVGYMSACAIDHTGGLVCWGADEERYGISGEFAGLDVQKVVVSWSWEFAILTTSGTLAYSMGHEDLEPVFALIEGDFVDVAADADLVWVIRADGSSMFYGVAAEEYGAPDLSTRQFLRLGGRGFCGILSGSFVYAWNYYGGSLVGNSWGGSYQSCSLGTASMAAIDLDGHVVSLTGMGEYDYGPSDRDVPPPHATFQSLSVGANHACGVTTTGWLKCWGGTSEVGEADPPIDGDRYLWL